MQGMYTSVPLYNLDMDLFGKTERCMLVARAKSPGYSVIRTQVSCCATMSQLVDCSC